MTRHLLCVTLFAYLVAPRPRYVRINTNLLTTSDAIRAFQDEGYRFIRCTSGSYVDYLEQIQNLTEEDFTQDYHVKTMFVFSSGTKLHEHELYLENKIILQDKVGINYLGGLSNKYACLILIIIKHSIFQDGF